MFGMKQKRIKQNGVVRLIKNGFEVTHALGVSVVEWSLIDKIVAYKVDLLTVDEICFEIDYLDKRLLITEESEGWENFLIELIDRIPEIDSKWEEKIIKPAFERNETELYNRNKKAFG